MHSWLSEKCTSALGKSILLPICKNSFLKKTFLKHNTKENVQTVRIELEELSNVTPTLNPRKIQLGHDVLSFSYIAEILFANILFKI